MKLRVISHFYDSSANDKDADLDDLTIILDGPDVADELCEAFDSTNFEDQHGTIDCGGDSEWFELELVDERDTKEEAEAAGIALMSAICESLGIEFGV